MNKKIRENSIVIKNTKLKGEVIPPPSKSILHRYIMAASLCDEKILIKNISLSDDILATINSMKILGANIEIKSRGLLIDGSSLFSKQKINSLKEEKLEIDCNESGSTLRFLIPLSILKNNRVCFKGKDYLFKRPLDSYFKIFDDTKIFYKFNPSSYEKLIIDGELKAGNYKISGNISSQFITGLLFSLPLLKENSKIEIIGELESKSYVNLTLNCLENFGIEIENDLYKTFYVRGNQKYIFNKKIKDNQLEVESDFSQAAFFIVANELKNNIKIKNLNKNSLQGDKVIFDLINEVKNDVSEILVIDGSNCPDIIPIFTLYAAYSNKKIKIENLVRLKMKECDRLSVTVSELSKLGFDLQEREDSILINYRNKTQTKKEKVFISAYNDHRIAMMIAIASTFYEGEIILKDYLAVRKSYPDFWEIFSNLGGIYYEYLGK